MLAKSKLNSIKTLIFQALKDLEISHEEFKTIVVEKKKVSKNEKFLILEDLLKKTDYNAKISEIERKISSISGLATNSALTAVENYMILKLSRKTNYDTKISDIESKYITTADYNKFTKDIVASSIKSKNLVDKSAIAGFISNAKLDKKVAALASKAELKAEQDKMIKLQAFDSSYFRGKSYFVDNDGTQNYLVFQSMYKYFKKISNTNYISEWKSKGLPEEVIKPLSTISDRIIPGLADIGRKIRVKFIWSCLKQDKIAFTHVDNNKKDILIFSEGPTQEFYGTVLH